MAKALWCVECGQSHIEPIANNECIKCGGHVFTQVRPAGAFDLAEAKAGKPTEYAPDERPVEAVVDAEVTEVRTEQPQPNGKEPSSALTEARALVPADAHGIAPADLGGQITYAKEMAKSGDGIPKHLRGNVGACLSVVDISRRSGMSPYMVANLSYVKDAGAPLSFMAQLWTAMLQRSGLMDGVLKYRFEGSGDDLVCIAYGKIKGDPEVLEWRSDRLADRHPGHVTKNGVKYVRGSPLWDAKPRVAMAYDTGRDWVRIHASVAVAGIPIDSPLDTTAQVAPRDALLDRLQTADRTNGHQEGHTDRELAKIGAVATEILPADDEGRPRVRPARRRRAKVAPKAKKRTSGRRRAK